MKLCEKQFDFIKLLPKQKRAFFAKSNKQQTVSLKTIRVKIIQPLMQLAKIYLCYFKDGCPGRSQTAAVITALNITANLRHTGAPNTTAHSLMPAAPSPLQLQFYSLSHIPAVSEVKGALLTAFTWKQDFNIQHKSSNIIFFLTLSATNRRSAEITCPPKSISEAELSKKKSIKKTKGGIKVGVSKFSGHAELQENSKQCKHVFTS